MKWKLEKLSTLCEINVGKTPSRDKQEYFGSGVTWVSIADMNNKVYIEISKEEVTDLGIRHANMKIVDTNTVLFSFKLSVGKVCITSKPVYTNEAIAALPIIDNNRLFTKYLYYAMQAQDFSHLGETAAKGLTLNKAKLNTIRIPLPPLPIQQKIAAILDEADALRRKDKALLAKYDELLQSVFYDMFGDPVKNEKGWEVKRLSEVCLKITDGTHLSPKFTDEGIPFLFVSNIIDNEINYKTSKYISETEYYELIKRTPVELGDILLTTVGSYGNPAIVKSDQKFCFQRHIAYLKPDKSLIDPYFLFGILKSPIVKMQIERKVRGVAQKTLNLFDLKNIEIFYPNKAVQNRFVSIAKNIQHQKSQIIQQQTHSEALFQSLMQRAFAGRLVG